MGYGSLASTGVSLTIGGLVLGLSWTLVLSLGLVLAGAFAVRYGFRRGKSPQEI